MSMPIQRRHVLPIFFVSGATGLIYQVIWVRELTTLLGSSTMAVTIILTAFMGGLGLGSWIFGRLADRLPYRRLLLAYVALEVLVGFYALLLPLLLRGAEGAYLWAYRADFVGSMGLWWARLAIAFGVLLVPTIGMGGTLPVIGRYLTRTHREFAGNAARLYAWNTFGAAAGAALAGYALLPYLGLATSTWTAAGLNFALGIAVWCIAQGNADDTVPSAALSSEAGPPVRRGRSEALAKRQETPEVVVAVLIAYAASGMAAMFYEVAWTRTLVMVLGTTVYAFTTMLVTFLLGVGLGSAIFRRLPDRLRGVNTFILLQLAVAAVVLLTVPMMDRLPLLYLTLRADFFEGWAGVQVLRFVMAGAIMAAPTLLMGVMFPLAVSLASELGRGYGKGIGRTYAANTLGGVMGAALAGLVLVPSVGMQATIVAGAILNVGSAALVTIARFQEAALIRWGKVAGMIAAVPFAVSLIDPWSPRLLSSGVYLYAENYLHAGERYKAAAASIAEVPELPRRRIWEATMRNYDLLYYGEGAVATVAVMENSQGVRSLLINGKVDASVRGEKDMNTQVMLGLLPPLLHPNPERTFVVGLGSGVTAGSVLRYPQVQEMVTAEIAPEVVEAARYFADFNNGVLTDPRSTVVERDARNILLTDDRSFDVVISQPSNPWIKGESSLFSLEWYRLVRDRLDDRGVFAQWIPAYHISKRNLLTIVRTLSEAFPAVSMWSTGATGDILLVAFKAAGHQVDFRETEKRLTDPAVENAIRSLDLVPDTLLRDLFIMDDAGIKQYLSRFADSIPLNTDDLLVTEFFTPIDMAAQRQVTQFSSPDIRADPASLSNIISNLPQRLHLPD